MLAGLRAFFNSLIFPIWTAACVSAALFAGFVKGDPDFFYRAQRGWARGLLRVCGIELEVTGAERMDPDGAYVIVSNHASYMDIPALFAALPQLPQFLAKRELSRIPFLGAALRSGRHVLVDRDSRTSAKDSLDRAAQHLKAGAAILIFAEGTRSTRDEIARFKSGAFRLAKLGQVAILPVGISGTRAVLPKHGRLIRPRRVQVHIGEPISAHDVESTPMNELCDRTRRQVSELAGLPLSNEA